MLYHASRFGWYPTVAELTQVVPVMPAIGANLHAPYGLLLNLWRLPNRIFPARYY